jgi:hypothetical protein
MSSYDDCDVATITASAGSPTNGLNFGLRIHKIAVTHADGVAQSAVSLFDAATAAGTAKVIAKANEVTDGTASRFEECYQQDFNPPVAFNVGVSSTITNAAVVKVYYTRK